MAEKKGVGIFARALMQRPSVILADEFVSQLDPVTADDILERVRGIAGRGVGLLITTHETDVVAKFADRILVMDEGRVAESGTHAELVAKGGLYGRLAALQFGKEAAE